jgi:UDP-galactopyranose mutase
MPDREKIYSQLKINRDKNLNLIDEKLPRLGETTFENYFISAIGPNLYNKFMKNYSWKMWNIPGNRLLTSMVWADMIHHHYSEISNYDPLKFEDHSLGKDIKFQVYPKKGWNIVWDKMVKNVRIIKDKVESICNKTKSFIKTKSGRKYFFDDYFAVINTIDIDNLWGEDILPYTGRMIIPIIFPTNQYVFPDNTESFHYADCEFQTRVTEMKRITRHESKGTLILIEIPVTSKISYDSFPDNTINFAINNNLFYKRAYAQQSKDGLKIYEYFLKKGKDISNLYHSGRKGQFKYWGMPETVKSSYDLINNNF